LKTLYRKRTVIWPFYFYTIIRTLSNLGSVLLKNKLVEWSLYLKDQRINPIIYMETPTEDRN
ncbi:hypothetical protein P7519_13665, partial [Staphylococcus aureus]|nr:hypothetical protein [Staphylococcus aureus]